MKNIDLEKTFEGLEILAIGLSFDEKTNLITIEAESKNKELINKFHLFLKKKQSEQNEQKKRMGRI